MKPLSQRYQLFADAKIRGESDTAAATTAGYKPSGAVKQGHRLSRNVQITNYIHTRKEAAAHRVGYTAEKVREVWMRIIEYGMQEVPVLDKQGEQIAGLFTLMDSRAAFGASVEFAKTLNMYEEHNDRTIVIQQVRELAREVGADEDAAVAEAEAWLATR